MISNVLREGHYGMLHQEDKWEMLKVTKTDKGHLRL